MFFYAALIAGLGSGVPDRVSAQHFSVLHNFTEICGQCRVRGNEDGAFPAGGLAFLDNELYGTASAGGWSGEGAVFRVNIDGSGFTNLYSLTGAFDVSGPRGDLILSGGTMFGTTAPWGAGFVFAADIAPPNFRTLCSFVAGEPVGLALAGKTLYGITVGLGSPTGAIFAVGADGSAFTNLLSFTSSTPGERQSLPTGKLLLAGDTLYAAAAGLVFKLHTDGSRFATLHDFSNDGPGTSPNTLILSDRTLYGTTIGGIASSNGTVFRINTDGSGFTNLYSFTALNSYTNSDLDSVYTNADGANPSGGLVLLASTLYGAARNGGTGGSGVLFAINTDGTGFTNLYSFDPVRMVSVIGSGLLRNGDGAYPAGGVISSGNTLYGTASEGGYWGNGTVFSFSLSAPQLSITSFEGNVELAWPTNAVGFRLQSTVTLGEAGWITTDLPFPPRILDGQYVVTIPHVSTNRQFYRLAQ